MAGLDTFLKTGRYALTFNGSTVRSVYRSEYLGQAEQMELAKYVASKAPLFYRDLVKIASDMSASQHFGEVVKDTLAKIPKSESFRESHFCEIVSGIFAEEKLGLTRIYSKLTLLTAENANAYKMDLVLCRTETDPVQFVFSEVKSSCKENIPAGHDKSCFVDLFRSFNEYKEADLRFDMTAARDRIEALSPDQRDKVKKALLPYGDRELRYAGFIVIDSSTFDQAESELLAKRTNAKEFDVDLLCIETLKDVSHETYARLDRQLEAF